MMDKLQNFISFIVNKKAYAFMWESILALILLIGVLMGYLAINYTFNDESIIMAQKLNDALIIISYKHYNDHNQELYQVLEFLFPRKNVNLYIDNSKVWGNGKTELDNASYCIEREETIIIKQGPNFLPKKFRLEFCN